MFSPDVDTDTLSNYLRAKLHHDVTCQKIQTAQTRFSSSKVTAQCDDVDQMYDPQLWPEGTFVWFYYEPHKPWATAGSLNANAITAASHVCVPVAGASAVM